jgi:hypothetical protein
MYPIVLYYFRSRKHLKFISDEKDQLVARRFFPDHGQHVCAGKLSLVQAKMQLSTLLKCGVRNAECGMNVEF